MVKPGEKLKRFLIGLFQVILLLGLIFSRLPAWIHTYGATENELFNQYPGDEILQNPNVSWTHAITINAPPEKIWPWIAQIGDTKAGFYSFTLIENLVSGGDVYHNASEIIPAYQNSKPGEEIITSVLSISEVKNDKYLLAATKDFMGMGWTWLWYLQPEKEDKTRLIIRMNIQAPPEMSNPVATWFLDAGGFVMEMGMLRGIKQRAEGGLFPSPIEPLEVLLWFGLLLEGLIAAWRFINRSDWQLPLTIGLTAVLGLVLFTFVQPEILLRVVSVLGLFGAIWFNKNSEKTVFIPKK